MTVERVSERMELEEQLMTAPRKKSSRGTAAETPHAVEMWQMRENQTAEEKPEHEEKAKARKQEYVQASYPGARRQVGRGAVAHFRVEEPVQNNQRLLAVYHWG